VRKAIQLAATLLAAGALALVVGIAPGAARTSTNSVTYQDSTGEDGGSLDIQQIVVSNDDKGLLTFEIHLGNAPALTGKNDVSIFIDSDNNPGNSGGPGYLGAEMVLDVSDGTVDVFKWNGTTFAFSGSPSSLTYSFATGVLTVKVNAGDLGLTSFNFWVGTDTDYSSDSSHLDVAPDPGHGSFAYQVKISPPAPPAVPKPTPKPAPKCKKGQKSTKAHPCHK
jgi:hypothetical protein